MGSEVDSAEFDRRTQCITAALGIDSTQPVSVIRQKIAVLGIDDARHLIQMEQRRADSKVRGKAGEPPLRSSFPSVLLGTRHLWRLVHRALAVVHAFAVCVL